MDEKKTLMFHGGQAHEPNTSPTAPRSPRPPPQQQPYGQQPNWQGQQLNNSTQQQPNWQGQQLNNAAAQPNWQGQNNSTAQPSWQGHGHQGQQQAWLGQANSMSAVTGAISRKNILLTVGGAIVLAIVSTVGLLVKDRITGGKVGKDTISYSRLGVDRKAVNVDELIESLANQARRWRKDASWWSLSIHGIRPNATVDFSTASGGKVTFVSAKSVQSASKRTRHDSIKEYSLTRQGARSTGLIGTKKPWKDFHALATPECSVSQLIARLGERGFKEGTVRISFDPSFISVAGWTWRVRSEDSKLAGSYSMDDCSFVKP